MTLQSNFLLRIVEQLVPHVLRGGEVVPPFPPIGSIVAWHKAFANTPTLPDGWVECDGTALDDAESVYDGQTIPDLNGGARFLRGSATSGTEQAENFLNHGHTLRGKAAAGNQSDLTSFSMAIAEHANAFRGTTPDTNMRSTSITNTGGSETRPINMSVVWIMRVK